MTNYRNHEVEDFVCDDFFMEWVLNPKAESSAFWDNWQRENPDRIKHIQNARAILLAIRVKENDKQLSELEVAEIAEQVKNKIANAPSAVREITLTSSFGWLKIAASILVVFSIAFAYNYLTHKKPSSQIPLQAIPQEVEFTRIRNTSQEGLVINLSDSSIVVLRPNSSLSFPKSFIDSTREVTLEGTGFFEVKKNPKMPFIVHAGNLTTKVLGTSFTVSSSANQPSKVVVYTGKVMVNRANNISADKWVVITPNQQVIYVPLTEELKKDTVTSHQILSVDMADRVFIFKETSFADVIEQIEKAYNVTIDYSDSKFGAASVTGDISKLPLNEKVKFVSKAVNAKCEIESGRIKIY